MNRFRITAITFCAVLTTTAATFAVDAELTFSTPTNPIPLPVIVQINRPVQGMQSVPVMIPPGTPVNVKRDMITASLVAAGYQAVAQPNLTKCTVQNLPAGSSVGIIDGGTGEIMDGTSAPSAASGGIGFPGHFDPMSYQNQPAIFTAGIVTDVGELVVQVTASELNFQTDGPIICQALFQRLVPRAPQYGAQINYAGDRLEVYFDPAYTVGTGGVRSGTTSKTQGAQNNTNFSLPPSVHLGDMNCDGITNALDIDGMIRAILDPATWQLQHPGCNILNGDFNLDGVVNTLDLNPFIQALVH